jgi:hypothetical protein
LARTPSLMGAHTIAVILPTWTGSKAMSTS